MRQGTAAVFMGLVALVLTAVPAAASTAGPQIAQFDPTSGQWHMRDAVGATHTFYYGVPGVPRPTSNSTRPRPGPLRR